MSIAKQISSKNSLRKLKGQGMFFDDQNAMNWLITSQASVAIIPYYLIKKFLKIDSRLSAVFPNKGVPLIWNFLLSKSKKNNQILIYWINSLEKRATIDKLANQGWFSPFNSKYSQKKYNTYSRNNNYGPSEICWKNSWSLSPLDNAEKLNLENLWNQSLTP